MVGLVVRDVGVRRGTLLVVENVSLEIAPSAWFGLVGANGSGKTSLLRAMAGRLPIAHGRVLLDGRDVSSDRSARATQIGFAPPIEHLPGALRGRDVLALAAGTPGKDVTRRHALWAALELETLLDKRVDDYSSGMRQRLSLALAFVRPTPVVVLDEPFNWLDPVAAYDVKIALADMVAQGTTLVTALHDLTTLCQWCDEGALLAEGRIACSISSKEMAVGRTDPGAFEQDMIAKIKHPNA